MGIKVYDESFSLLLLKLFRSTVHAKYRCMFQLCVKAFYTSESLKTIVCLKKRTYIEYIDKNIEDIVLPSTLN